MQERQQQPHEAGEPPTGWTAWARGLRWLASAIERRRHDGKPDAVAAADGNWMLNVFEALPVGLGVVDGQGRTLSLNPVALRMHGFTTLQEMLVHFEHYGQAFELLTPTGEKLPMDQWPLARALRGDYVHGLDVVLHRLATGQKRLLSYSAVPLAQQAGPEGGVAFVMQDVTERRRVEEELREIGERFRTLADNMSQLAWMADPAGWIFWYNRRWYEYTGTTLEEMQGWGWTAVHHPDHVDRVVDRVQHAWDTGELWEDTFPLRGRDGQYRWFLSRAVPIRDASGAVIRWFGTNTDITEQREAEQALRESEARFKRIADTAPALLWITDSKARCTFLSRRWFETTGQTFAEARGVGWLSAVHVEDQPRVRETFLEANQAQEAFRVEYRLRQADGSYRWAVDVGQPRFDATNRFRGYIGSVMDIHERRRAEEQLQRSNSLLDAVLDALPAGVIIADAAGKVVRDNQANRELWGMPPQTDSWQQYEQWVGYWPDTGKRIEPHEWAMARALLHGEVVRGELVECEQFQTGQRRLYLNNAAPVLDADGNIVAGVVAEHDVTDLLRAQQALRESQQRYEEVFDTAAAGIALVGLDGLLLRVNQRFCDIVGYSSDELVGMSYKQFTHPEDLPDNAQYYERLQTGGLDSYSMRKRYIRKDGSIVWVQLSASMRRDAAGNPLYGIGAVQDISAQMNAERQLQQVNANLEARVEQRTRVIRQQAEQVRELALEVLDAEDRERKRIAAVLHDDLQQMLAAVRMRLGMLKQRLSADQQESLGNVDALVDRCIGSARSLALELSPPILQTAGLVAALNWLGNRFGEQHDLKVHVEADVDAEAPADNVRSLLFHAARELLFNVVKHAETHEAWLRLRRAGSMLELEVEDRGKGCPQPLNSASAGLGLFGISQRIERLGGRTRMEAAPGRGCRVTLAVGADAGNVPPDGV